MKIIEHGKPCEKTIKRFCCEHCGCIFEADNSEYDEYLELGNKAHHSIDLLNAQTKYSCRCPDCGNKAKEGG